MTELLVVKVGGGEGIDLDGFAADAGALIACGTAAW
jgi:hypothetical protein